jgi:hypothetical protein
LLFPRSRTAAPASDLHPHAKPFFAITSVPTLNPSPSELGLYVVKQIENLGHETISGVVCSLASNFTVSVAAPKVTFDFKFFPHGADRGAWIYAYSIPSAGETHDQAGSYTVSPAAADGTLLVSTSGSDHVTFKGYDGMVPVNYKFNLVPSNETVCPNN